MAGSGAPERQLRRGPAPIASFDHDVSDESSPESKQSSRLAEIREAGAAGSSLAPPEPRPRSHSSPAAPRIDISRASSSSHHDSRDSSPELALFAGGADRHLGFREDGALELRSSTEELAFLEPAPAPAARRDSQGSEAALLAVSGRASRLSSIGSQCSAHSALSAFSHVSRVSHLSVVSGVSRSPSPHRMLLETSFCGPKPIETDPEICAAAVEERLLEIAKLSASSPPDATSVKVDARDRREVRTEATVERASRPPPPSPIPTPVPVVVVPPPVNLAEPTILPAITPLPTATPTVIAPATPVDDKIQKENRNRARVEGRRTRPRVRRELSEPEVYKSGNRTKDIIRIKLKPDDEYEETEEDKTARRSLVEDGGTTEMTRKSTSLEIAARSDRAVRPSELIDRNDPAPLSPTGRTRIPRDSRTPSPAGAPVSRKSSFCSLFKSRETIASPELPSDALHRKRSLTEGRSRSKSRDLSTTPSSSGKIRGSVLSLFKTPRKSGSSPSPSSREGSPVVHQQRPTPPVVQPSQKVQRRGEKLKYYEDTRDGIIHIPLRTPPEERPGSSGSRREPEPDRVAAEAASHRKTIRPASAPQSQTLQDHDTSALPSSQKPVHRTVLPDGSIIIPLRSPTERTPDFRTPDSPTTGITDPSTPGPSRADADRPTASAPSVDSVEVGAAPPARLTPLERSPEAVPDSNHVENASTVDDGRRRRRERILFTTHVGSREQVFSTQLSITKTPSVTSEISGSLPSFVDPEEARASTAPEARPDAVSPAGESSSGTGGAEAGSSGSEGGAEGGCEAERRGLVLGESFEDELPYVPTTLPQERSLALPMVPVRERAAPPTRALQRPRAVPAPRAALPRPPPAHTPPPAPAPADRIRIRLPRRPRTASVASVTTATAAPASRVRTRSGGDESRPKTEWIDFEEVPERRKQPKRIQTLPAAAGGAGVVFSYVEPDQCRCECHHARDPHSSSSLECADGETHVQLDVQISHPFTADLDLHPEAHVDEASSRPR